MRGSPSESSATVVEIGATLGTYLIYRGIRKAGRLKVNKLLPTARLSSSRYGTMATGFGFEVTIVEAAVDRVIC